MADEPEDDDFDIPSSGGGLSSVLLGLNLVLGAVGAGGVGWLILGGGAASANSADAEEPAVVHTLEPIIVNLNETDTTRYLKVGLDLEVAGQPAADELTSRDRAVRHALLQYLSNLKVAETLGTENRDRIRADIHGLLDEEVGKGKVLIVYVTEFVVQ
jgi:flagellar FliL protein